MKQLNEDQQNVVNSKFKNILVIACPGSGKTTTIISRYIKLVKELNKDPKKIILTTFTKKSGEDIKKKLEKELENEELMPKFIGTVHKLAYDVLKEHGLKKIILDDIDSQVLLSNCINQFIESDYDIIRNIKKIIQHSSIEYPFNIDNYINKYEMNSYKKINNDIFKKYSFEKNK